MEILLKTNNLTKRFKKTDALNNVNMTIYRGDIYGFVGENGAGKSTLIRVVTNILRPTAGTFTLNVAKRLGSVGAIVESPAFHPGLTALQNLRYQSDLLGYKHTDEDLASMLDKVGLEEQRGSKKVVKNFSLGMKQRLSIALTLLSNPEFILLDEPMNGLDPAGIKEMRDLILRLNKEGTTFLISSHILTELDKVATRYGFISHGELVEEIAVKDLAKKAKSYTEIILMQPLNDEVRELLKGFTYSEEGTATLIFSQEEEAQKALKLLMGAEHFVSAFEVVRETIEDYYLQKINKGVGA
ncbi:MAG: ATP-binding cassette domain-containing protein [Bacilli bacterium]|jgi:ABC-2 type transport system ATP-binding protein